MEKDINDLMEKGITSLALNQFETSLSYFNEILEIDAHNLAALNNKCLALNGLGKFNDALEGFDKILYQNPEFYYSLVGKAETLYFLEYYDSSIDYFNRALKIDSKNESALYGKSKVFNKLEEFNEVIRCFDELKKLSSKSWLDDRLYKKISRKSKNVNFNRRAAFINKINVFIMDEKYSEALDALEDALKLDQKSTFFLYNKGYALYKLGNYEDAASFMDKILKIDFMNVDALKIKSEICIKLNNYDGALVCLDNIKKFGSEVDDIIYNEVVQNCQNSSDELPLISSFIQKGNEQLVCGDYDKALSFYEQELESNPQNVVALNNKGFIFYILDKYDLAIQSFNQALSINDKYTSSLLGKSYSLYFLGDFVNSLKCYEQIINLDSTLFDNKYFELLRMKIDE